MCYCSMCCDQQLGQLQLSELPVVSKNARMTWYRRLQPIFYDLLDRIRCSDHRLCNHCRGILKLAQKNCLFLKSSISMDHCTVNANMFQFHSKKIPFIWLLLMPSFARRVQVQVATQFFMICRTAVCVLTAVLILYFQLLPDNSDLLPEDSQLGAERRKKCRGTWCFSPRPLWCSISSCSQVCAIHATSGFSPAASTHTVITSTNHCEAVRPDTAG
jgi:hypothetical protein